MNLEEALVAHGAPTLAAIKVANLFRYHAPPGAFQAEFDRCCRRLRPRGVQLSVLKRCQRTGSYLVYVYREEALRRVLSEDGTRAFLERRGYMPAGGLRLLLSQLSDRLCLSGDFPHEIGVFLGYPLRDVLGFIQNGGKHYRCAGCWKVYGDVDAAERCFAQYAACTQIYRSRYRQGTPMGQLIVPAPQIQESNQSKGCI